MFKVVKLKKIVFFVFLFVMIFGIFYYKNFLFGNNIIKNRSDNVEDILNEMKNYCADVSVTVTSNKTENLYDMYQEVQDEYSMQELKDEVKIEINGSCLRVSNTSLGLEKVYENYSNLMNNSLFLNCFVNDYQNEMNKSNCYEKNGEMIYEVKLSNSYNTYIKYKKLYVDSKTKLPTKLEVKDDTQNKKICIVYNNIELK